MTLTKTFGIGYCVGFEGLDDASGGLVGLDDASGGLVGLDDASGGLVGLDDVSKGNAETSTGGGVLDLSSGIHQYRSSMTIRQAAWTARNQPSATHLPHSPSHLY
jgi:hypothetical protein